MKVAPYLPSLYHTNEASRHAIFYGDVVMKPTIRNYRSGLRFTKFCHPVPFAFCHFPKPLSVVHVVETAAPIKIVQNVVGFVAILVANLLGRFARANERTRHKPMDIVAGFLSLLRQFYCGVPIGPNVRSNDLRGQRPEGSGSIPHLPFMRTDTANVGNFINSIITAYRKPFFHAGKLPYVAHPCKVQYP